MPDNFDFDVRLKHFANQNRAEIVSSGIELQEILIKCNSC